MKIIAILAVAAVTTFANAQLALSWTATGNVEGQVFGAVDPTFSNNYSISVSGLPTGFVMQKAFLYANEWNNTINATATFAGTTMGPTSAYLSDNGLDVYKWDVTGLVLGNGNYSVQIAGPVQNNGVALAMVYAAGTLPQSMVQLNDGAFNMGDLGPEQQSTSFSAFPGGTGTLSIYTQGDDNSSSAELVKFNGATVGGPLDGNLGPHASILNIPVTVLANTNTATLTTTTDQYGWQVAMLNNPVPEPASAVVFGLGALLFGRRLKKSRR